ncbi:MAG: D-alanyl-D-alanine carboxypeptidase, partial [Chitinophagaceae bacterium]|nr:D-alanyl-D-alanine carboxypeptidase [Chitinophagaceae bacterium]
KKIARSVEADVLTSKALQTAHVGISIFDPATDKYLYNYQGDKYFVPASNTKIPTCYAAMKYLGDSLVGLKYKDTLDYTVIKGTGDPTFLHADFKNQVVYEFLNKTAKRKILISHSGFKARLLGNGWAWNDFNESYMAERSLMPIYGNVAKFQGKLRNLKAIPDVFEQFIGGIDSFCCDENKGEDFGRLWDLNRFYFRGDPNKYYKLEIPYYTRLYSGLLLGDTLRSHEVNDINYLGGFVLLARGLENAVDYSPNVIHSQPTDSLLKPMMHRSDNFFAEQSLLMVSNEKLGYMSDEKIIDTLLKTDFKDLPQKPRWADGSGLSRYNLFTPQDFVAILNKMK